MHRTWMALLIIVFSFSAFAENQALEGYNKRFILKRDSEGTLTAVKMRFTSSFSLKPYLVQIKNDLKQQIERMRNADKAQTQKQVDELVDYLIEHSDKSSEAYENAALVKESILNLPNINVEKSFAKIHDHGVLKNFEFDLKKALKMLDLSIIADPTDARFFYRKNVTYEVVKRAIEFAKKKFDNVPVLNLVLFVVVKVHDLVLEQRTFHQNMLLHYLENFSDQQLAMTKDEADHVFSSIFESRIPVTGYSESQRAAANWARYGTDKFFAIVRNGNNRIRRSIDTTISQTNKLNWGFVKGLNSKGEKVVFNLINNQHMFSSKMSEAYNFDKPEKIKTMRSLLNLGELGLGFLPISGWIKSMATQFIESFYVQQKLTEGALVGYFESNGDSDMFQAIMKQNINPYILVH